ncbi:AraC family transcriptional regulator, partial [Enterococcus sp. S181_ASV_20]|nr:AraC family transcriptional regulator [Enterococcus sp. S181_ASV_20]
GKAISYINKNYARVLTIKEVADHVYLSPFHFSRVFKNEIHVNFNTYLNQQRIKQAKNLLTQSSLSVNAISKEIGFSQTSYFCKIFRSFVGTTPAKYRKK